MKIVKLDVPTGGRARYMSEMRMPETYEDAIELLRSHARLERANALRWLREHAADDERAFRLAVVETLADIYYKGDRFVPTGDYHR